MVLKVGDDEETGEFERQGFVWIDKEKMIPGPLYRAEDYEETGDRKFTRHSSFLITLTYNLDPNLHKVETRVKNAARI